MTDLGFFEPQIHFSSSAPWQWLRAGITLPQLAAELDRLRLGVKKGTGYRWDNSHFFIDDIFGRPALQLLVDTRTLCLWEAHHKTGCGDYDHIPTDLDAILEEASAGRVRCSECGRWGTFVGEGGTYRHWSFAGAVCPSCYDPKRHVGPDTRGD